MLFPWLRRFLGGADDEPQLHHQPPQHLWPGPRAGAAVLFLDFDGVLHPGQSETFEFLPDLYRILDALPDLDVVVSSTWRDTATPEYLLNLFREPYRERVRDVIGPEPALPFARQLAIEAYVAARGLRRFLAVDDSAELFRPNCPWLVRVERHQGIGGSQAGALLAALSVI